MEFTSKEAIEYAKNGKIEAWIHAFLQGIGNNKELSNGLKREQRYYLGPDLVKLDQIHRCCGPEDEMEFHNPRESWELRVHRLQKLIRKGWDMPPLIVQNINGFLSIRDGNGRHEALKREKHESCYVIIWDNDETSLEKLKLQGDIYEYK